MQLSIVIPLFNEADSLKELAGWITDVMQKNAISHELLFIDDGSTDDSWNY
jgi:glycosyltransferase involved in cell wall biosynthesis